MLRVPLIPDPTGLALRSRRRLFPSSLSVPTYDMRSFMEQCVARYVELCGPKYKATLRSADTPFLDESRPEFDVNLATQVIHPLRLVRVCWGIALLLC